MSKATISNRKLLGIKVIQWIILGMFLVPPVSHFEGGDGGTGDGPFGSISIGEIGYPYRWKYTRYTSAEGQSVKYNYPNYLKDGLILSILSPFILEPIKYLLDKLNLKENASKYYQQKNH
ncbi:hypothetical protein E4H04_09000 [Candidatus Bathyarchaeota archaeon]|nr:MAG: hypothetical protein E4H04_09000 [Candidatus Bathyarchaeota archaeon]